QAQPAQRLRLVAVFDPREVRDDDPFRRPDQAQLEAAATGLIRQRSIAGDIFRLFGEALDPYRALHAVRPGDATQAHLLRLPLTPALSPRSGRVRGFALPSHHDTRTMPAGSAPTGGGTRRLLGGLRPFLGARLRPRLDRVIRDRRLGDQPGIAEKPRDAVGR